jgi:hypothetical protein
MAKAKIVNHLQASGQQTTRDKASLCTYINILEIGGISAFVQFEIITTADILSL